MAIRRGLGHHVGAERAARPAAGFDDEGLAELVREFSADGSRGGFGE